MKVGELLEWLKELDPELSVEVYDYDFSQVRGFTRMEVEEEEGQLVIYP